MNNFWHCTLESTLTLQPMMWSPKIHQQSLLICWQLWEEHSDCWLASLWSVEWRSFISSSRASSDVSNQETSLGNLFLLNSKNTKHLEFYLHYFIFYFSSWLMTTADTWESDMMTMLEVEMMLTEISDTELITPTVWTVWILLPTTGIMLVMLLKIWSLSSLMFTFILNTFSFQHCQHCSIHQLWFDFVLVGKFVFFFVFCYF